MTLPNAADNEDLLITETEWRAVLRGARALRDEGARLRRVGAERLSAECDKDAAALQGLAERAVMAAAHDAAAQEQAYAMYEALIDPVDRAMRDDDAAVTGRREPSDEQLRAEFDRVCRELGLRPSVGDRPAEPEAER